jgi:hypothetical protein
MVKRKTTTQTIRRNSSSSKVTEGLIVRTTVPIVPDIAALANPEGEALHQLT